MRILDTCVNAVASGGTLLIVGHHPDGLPPWGRGSPPAELYYTPEQLVEDLALDSQSWTIDILESRIRTATGPDGQDAILTDTVLRATRIRDNR
jgi:hypothetical protein